MIQPTQGQHQGMCCISDYAAPV